MFCFSQLNKLLLSNFNLLKNNKNPGFIFKAFYYKLTKNKIIFIIYDFHANY
jgi:hypothetical protein